jgi:hypothetical protein
VNQIATELKQQYHCALDMLQSRLEACTDEVWAQEFNGTPFWCEAYHAIFWVHKHLGTKDKQFTPQPFGRSIDPTFFNLPINSCERTEALGFVEVTRRYCDEVFAGMTDEALAGPDYYDEQDFRSVFHRLMCGLRHGQHRVGKLAAYLDETDTWVNDWAG